MGKMADTILEKWKKSGSGGKQTWKGRGLAALLVGILLLVIAIPDGKDTDVPETSSDGSGGAIDSQAYIAGLEEELKQILGKMEGVGEVDVMITMESSAEKVVEKDRESSTDSQTETDSQGGSRKTEQGSQKESTIFSGGSGSAFSDTGSAGQSPYVTKETAPSVEGVIVVADGGGDAVVRKNITECVQALFGIDTHKIRIVKRMEN